MKRTAMCVLLAMSLACNGEDNGNNGNDGEGILVTITGATVTDVELRIRDIDYHSDELSRSNVGDLTRDPFVVLLLSGPESAYERGEGALDATWTVDMEEQVLLHGRGFVGGELTAAGAVLAAFERGKRVEVEIVLSESFNDADGDGFESCNEAGCDCNDQNDTINPFTVESCDDLLDNNCSGLPINEGCDCNPDVAPERPCVAGVMANFPELAGIGVCTFGTQRCVETSLGIFEWEESCSGGTVNTGGEIDDNGLDDNCNGVVDEGSACTVGQTRRCFLGWIEPFPTDYAVDAAGVGCVSGIQTCGATGHWDDQCQGEVRPQRSLDGMGWAELPGAIDWTLVAQDEPPLYCSNFGQCDGIDNDCDGQFDEEPYFDGDGDGFTRCGTNVAPGGDPTDPDDKVAGMSADFIDCDDAANIVNPGQAGICGNVTDEDCRCDHDSMARPASDPDSEIGKPYLQIHEQATCMRPQPTCAATSAYLDCGRLPRSDENPTGVCKDGPIDCMGCEPYYHGYFPADGTPRPDSDKDCYLCEEQFGFGCSDTTGTCSTQAEVCETCDAPPPTGAPGPGPQPGVVELERPFCTLDGSGCTGTDAPVWSEVLGEDPNEECPGFDCTGYYCAQGAGGSGIIGGRCFEKVDQSAADVNCNGRDQCQTQDMLCPGETDCKTAPVTPPDICQEAVSGCIGTSGPVYSDQANNSDLFSDCSATFICAGFFYGIESDGTGDQCYLRADVPDSSCNGSGNCQNQIEACSTSGRGAIVAGRPSCQMPVGGCTDQTTPTYGFVTAGTDPYGDCTAPDTCSNGSCS